MILEASRAALDGFFDYESLTYRVGEDRALTILEHGGAVAAVLRPWNWKVAWRDEVHEIPTRYESALTEWTSTKPRASALISLSELAIWASRRSGVSDLVPSCGCSDEPMFYAQRGTDAQRCGSMIINRRHVREALQVFIEYRQCDLAVDISIVDVDTGNMLRLEAVGTKCFVMGMKDDTVVGFDPMPGWPHPSSMISASVKRKNKQ